MKSLGERLRQLRKELGMTQADLERLVHVDRSHISEIERGEARPSDLLISALASKLNVTEEWLRTGKGPQRPPIENVISEATRFYSPRERIEGLLRAIETEAGRSAMRLRDLVGEAKGNKVLDLEDAELRQMVTWLVETYKNADPRTRTWLAVQFERAFPDFKEDLLKKQGKPGERPEAAAAGDIG